MYIILGIKKLCGIENLSLWTRKRKQDVERLFFHKKFTAKDILDVMISQGLKPGDTIVIHCAMNNFYNYKGNAQELIDIIIDYLGEEGTLCMPAYPFDKDNPTIPFDVNNDKTAAGFLAETFRHYKGVRRSLNKLHSVCALGKNADYLTCEHQYSKTCFDEKSPYYKLTLLNGKSFSLGLPKYYIGTICHVAESQLFNTLQYYTHKFTVETTFKYITETGKEEYHSIFTKSKQPYIRSQNTKLIDKYFDKTKYSRIRLSNIWINMFDARYCTTMLKRLALNGLTIYKSPKFYENI